MRYLKRFNEVDFKYQSITEAISQEDIKDFCEQYLAYLLDDGYALDFRVSGRVTQIDLVKPQDNPQHGRWRPGFGGTVDWMDWDHIKDRFIPFLQMLDKEYDVKVTNYYTYNDIINDDLSPFGGNLRLESIMIKIGRKLT